MKGKSRYYEKGWFCGHYGIRYYDDVDYNIDTFKGKPIDEQKRKRKAWYVCPLCNNLFVARNDSVNDDSIKSCGCRHSITSKINVKIMNETRPTPGIDILGQRFNRLVVEAKTDKRDSSGNIIWLCRCDCGKTAEATHEHLVSGRTSQCLDCVDHRKARTYIGKRFHKLVILEILDGPNDKRASNGGLMCKVQCDCGNIKVMPLMYVTREKGFVQTCGSCQCSQGEEAISNILKDNYIVFTQQQTFSDCINPKTNCKLKFDFYLPDYNICIEYDGQQHFHSIDYFGGDEGLRKTQYRDKIKDDYCKNNGIGMIRIPYTDLNDICYNYIMDKIKEVSTIECE